MCFAYARFFGDGSGLSPPRGGSAGADAGSLADAPKSTPREATGNAPALAAPVWSGKEPRGAGGAQVDRIQLHRRRAGDRRRRFEASAMAEAEATQDGEAPVGPPSARALDLSNIRGFQVFPAASEAPEANPIDDETLRLELAKELAARATRLAEAVDDALTLANDGAIRWLGDPIAKLVPGEEALRPGAVILAHEALPAEGREAAQRRVALWLVAHVRKTLGPLIDLAEPESVPEGVRDLALKLSQSLGVLERERVKTQVKALDQTARGALRKLGVRFGAFYIYVPALLKPASRTLCAQLWALLHADPDKQAIAERLLHFASSGRTSFAVEPPASGDVYRVAGFRLCGDRAVRVDIVERLTDLIRAALPRPTRSGSGAPTEQDGAGFVVTNQMTSLTGCSGEHFASILRSLGFASHKVKKSEFLAAARRAAAAAASAPAKPAPAQSEPSGQPEAAGDAAPTTIAERSAPTAAAAGDEPAPSESQETSADSASPVESDGGALAPPPAAAETSEAQGGVTGADEEKPDEDELIEVWRPAPRRPRHAGRNRPRPSRGVEAAAAPVEGAAPPQQAPPRKPWRDRRHAAGPRPAQPEAASPSEQNAPGGAERPAAEPAREARRSSWRRDAPKRPRTDDGRAAAPTSAEKTRPRPPPPEQHEPSVNLDSPFAKLLDLKPLLKARDTTK
jgi:ATP-dependent RNA helicase SUPV3L1/SUV3